MSGRSVIVVIIFDGRNTTDGALFHHQFHRQFHFSRLLYGGRYVLAVSIQQRRNDRYDHTTSIDTIPHSTRRFIPNVQSECESPQWHYR